MMHRTVFLATFALLVGFGVAVGAECKVEDWRYRYSSSTLWIEGTTTCKEGRIHIRAYDTSGEKERFIGVEDTYIEGFIFKAYLRDIQQKPSSMDIKYSIDP